MLKAIPEGYQDKSKGTLKLLWEEEWRALGITQVGSVPSGDQSFRQQCLNESMLT